MKHYEKLVDYGVFSRKKLAQILDCCDATAVSVIREYLKKGYIERVRHDLYAVISIETKQPVMSRYQIGSNLFDDACISHHSAFEVFGYANQVFYDTYVSTRTNFKDFEYNGIHYHRLAPKTQNNIEKNNSICVTNIEQTVIDSINDLEKVAGLEETIRCIELIPALNYKMLLNILSEYNNGFLYQKCGYLFEELNNSLNLPECFFIECKKNIAKTKRYISKDHNGCVWHKKWNIYAPETIQNAINKGMNDYDAI